MSQQEELNPNDTLQGVAVLRNLIDQVQMLPSQYRVLELYLKNIELDINELIITRSLLDKCGCKDKKNE